MIPRASRTLPEGYVHGGSIRLAGNRALYRRLTVVGLLLFPIGTVVLGALAALVRPEGWTFGPVDVPVVLAVLILLVGLAVTYVATIVVHEAVHGVLIWALTGTRPVFGFKGFYAYADAPGWYLTRGPMLTVLLAPLVLLPAIGLPVIALAPAGVSLFVFIGLVINAVGSAGDLYLSAVALRVRGPVVFGDEPGASPGEAGAWYVPPSLSSPDRQPVDE